MCIIFLKCSFAFLHHSGLIPNVWLILIKVCYIEQIVIYNVTLSNKPLHNISLKQPKCSIQLLLLDINRFFSTTTLNLNMLQIFLTISQALQ